MKKIITTVLLSALCATTGTVAANASSNYPDGPVKIIVPYSAGGGSDSVSRALAEALKSEFPDGIAVENRTGGAGSIGMSYGMNSKADGSIVTMIAPELVMLPHTGNGGDIDYKKFKPLAMVNVSNAPSNPRIATSKGSSWRKISTWRSVTSGR